MITITTFLAECPPVETEEEMLMAQPIEQPFFNIEDDEKLECCRASLSSHLLVYASGYIEIAQYGDKFMDQRHQDYVLWLWMVISDGLAGVVYNNTETEIMFPDRSLSFVMTPRKNNVLLEIKDRNNTHKSVLYPRDQFLKAIVSAGIELFTRILKFNGSQRLKEVLGKFEHYQEVLYQ